MSDFLKNLRSSHKKEPTNLRKPFENHYYPPQQDRRMNRDRRNAGHYHDNKMENLPQHTGNLIPEILENLTTISELMERLVISTESLNKVKVKQSEVMTDFFTTLQSMMNTAPKEPETHTGSPRATTSYASGTHYTKDEILSMIRDMRDQGATFAIIADYLQEKGIPTFSGRGEWHAQTIHRLCK